MTHENVFTPRSSDSLARWIYIRNMSREGATHAGVMAYVEAIFSLDLMAKRGSS